MKPSRKMLECSNKDDDVGRLSSVARSQIDHITGIRSETEAEAHKTELTDRVGNKGAKLDSSTTKDRVGADRDGQSGSEHDECLRRLETVQNELLEEIALNEGLREQLQLYMIECGDYQRMKDEDDRTIRNLTSEVNHLRIDKEDMGTRLNLCIAECDRLQIGNYEYSMMVAKLENSIKSQLTAGKDTD